MVQFSGDIIAYDAFISHASEDKNDFVEPLVNLLEKEGFKIWYDKFCIDDGASIPLAINQGIAESKYGIVIFSKAYFKKKWPQEELAALTSKDLHLSNILIPIWYKISLDDMTTQAPLWSHRRAPIFPDTTIKQIAIRVIKKLKKKAIL